MRGLMHRCAQALLPGLASLALLLPLIGAVRIPVTPVPGSGYIHAPRRLAARANSSSVGIEVENVSNVEYLGNITLNGETFTVILDTGRYASSLAWCRSEVDIDGRPARIYG